MDDAIAPIADELSRALGVDRETLQRELTLLIIEYKVPPEEAKRSLLKKHKRSLSAGRGVRRVAEETIVPPGLNPVPEEPPRPLKDLRVGDAGITVIGNVIDPEYREISTPRGTAAVISGMLEDSTARLHFTAWADIPDIFKVKSIVARDVYVKSFHGMPGININEKTVLEAYEGDIPAYVRSRRSLKELCSTDGAYDVETEGDVLSLRPGSGLIERCPTCSRVMQKGQCRAHGRLEGIPDLRIKAVIDDGTGSMICVLDRILTENLIGMSLEDLRAEPDRAAGLISAGIIGKPLLVRGNVTSGDFGMIFVAAEAVWPTDSSAEMARQLLGEIK
ncbi:single-stranded DNA-binding protein [Methanocella sp. MCL-LM]|uniref:single-stranded DNA-binding protein n=1 Tax=Methanocella sp. MCL-LM TaxID=3412035 RepID=UPI003C772068